MKNVKVLVSGSAVIAFSIAMLACSGGGGGGAGAPRVDCSIQQNYNNSACIGGGGTYGGGAFGGLTGSYRNGLPGQIDVGLVPYDYAGFISWLTETGLCGGICRGVPRATLHISADSANYDPYNERGGRNGSSVTWWLDVNGGRRSEQFQGTAYPRGTDMYEIVSRSDFGSNTVIQIVQSRGIGAYQAPLQVFLNSDGVRLARGGAVRR